MFSSFLRYDINGLCVIGTFLNKVYYLSAYEKTNPEYRASSQSKVRPTKAMTKKSTSITPLPILTEGTKWFMRIAAKSEPPVDPPALKLSQGLIKLQGPHKQ